jgi:hypothetical protein
MKRWTKTAVVTVALLAAGSAGAAWAGEQTNPGPVQSPGSPTKLLGGGITGDTYVPIVPCRLVDTRIAGGRIPNGVARGFDAKGSGANFAANQGGKAGGCGIPTAGVSAVEITVTAVLADHNGYARVYPGTEPTATFLNYTKAFNTAGTGSVAVCGYNGGICILNRDFLIKNYFSSSHFVVDVQGYYQHSMSALINGTGTVARHSRVVSSQKLGTGQYEVVFDRDVTTCTYVASLKNNSDGGGTETDPRAGVPNGVFVGTRDDAGTLDDRAFYLQVTC